MLSQRYTKYRIFATQFGQMYAGFPVKVIFLQKKLENILFDESET